MAPLSVECGTQACSANPKPRRVSASLSVRVELPHDLRIMLTLGCSKDHEAPRVAKVELPRINRERTAALTRSGAAGT